MSMSAILRVCVKRLVNCLLRKSSMDPKIMNLKGKKFTCHSFLQINLLMGRKLELERRIELLQGEREGLSSTLDESADRIIMLEKQTRDQDSIVSFFLKVFLIPEFYQISKIKGFISWSFLCQFFMRILSLISLIWFICIGEHFHVSGFFSFFDLA